MEKSNNNSIWLENEDKPDDWEEIMATLYKLNKADEFKRFIDQTKHATLVPRKISDDLLCLTLAMQDIRDSSHIRELLTKYPECRISLETWLHNYLRPTDTRSSISPSPQNPLLSKSMDKTNI